MDPNDKHRLALRIAWMAGVFVSVVGIIMLMNYWQLKRTDPLESKVMEYMVEQLSQDRQNENLREEIRNLDLMARKAYFTKQWQIRAGGYLLIGGMVVLVIALRIVYSLKSEVAEPAAKDLSLKAELLVSRKWILASIGLVFGLALLAAFLADDHLADSYKLLESSARPPESSSFEETVITPAVTEIEISGMDEVAGTPADLPEEETPVEEELSAVSGEEPVNIPEDPATGPETSAETGKTVMPESQFPSFRGPFGLGRSGHKNLPVDWNGPENKNIIWKIQVPYPGYNSPVIWEDDLFLTGADENNQIIFCYDRNSGDLKWQHEVTGIPRPAGNIRKPTDDTGYAAPSAATDGQHVAAIFATGDVACVDRNGNRIWAKNLGIPDNHYGHSSSLLIWNNLLLVQFDGNDAGRVLALDVRNGQEKWSTIRKSKISWASPILVMLDKGPELILSSSPHVAAYDPLTGEEKWAVESLSGEVGPSPAFADGIVFAANEYATLLAIRPGNPPEILWETNEYLPEVSSPVAAEGMLFIGTSYGVIACYDTTNGEILWEYECDQGLYASPIIADGKVYFLDMDGIMHIFKLDRNMTLIGEPELGEETVSSPAFADRRLYIRGMEHLYCIGQK